jgi:hypothetical protein
VLFIARHKIEICYPYEIEVMQSDAGDENQCRLLDGGLCFHILLREE